MTWGLVVTALLNWPSVYIYLYEKARQTANPNAYPFEWMERQPDFIALWWLIGAVARVPLVFAALALCDTRHLFATIWRASVIVARVVAMFMFEFAVSFYERLVG